MKSTVLPTTLERRYAPNYQRRPVEEKDLGVLILAGGCGAS